MAPIPISAPLVALSMTAMPVSQTDSSPWIIGGVVVVAIVALCVGTGVVLLYRNRRRGSVGPDAEGQDRGSADHHVLVLPGSGCAQSTTSSDYGDATFEDKVKVPAASSRLRDSVVCRMISQLVWSHVRGSQVSFSSFCVRWHCLTAN